MTTFSLTVLSENITIDDLGGVTYGANSTTVITAEFTIESILASNDLQDIINSGRAYIYDQDGVLVLDLDKYPITVVATPNWDDPIGDATFTYDVDGNIETKTVGSTVLSYFYDVNGNLDYITDGTNVKTFTYDVNGNVEDITYS